MPTNLPPDYFEVEKKYRSAKSTEEKIRWLEELLSTVPKHKGTEKLRGDLRKRLSKLKVESQTRKGVHRQESIYQIRKEGAGQVVVVGLANVGKSSLVRALTNATPEVAEYPFTTWTPTPGMMPVADIQVQLIDTPPLDKDYLEPGLAELIRTADVVLMVVDLQTYPLQQFEDSLAILEAHRVIPKWKTHHEKDGGRLVVKPVIVLVNKVDDASLDEEFEVLCELLGGECPLRPISALTGRHNDSFKQAVIDELEIIRVYARPPGEDPDLSAPFVLKKGSTVADFAAKVHQDFIKNLKSARLWGSGVFEGQMVGRDHVLQDGDVVELRI